MIYPPLTIYFTIIKYLQINFIAIFYLYLMLIIIITPEMIFQSAVKDFLKIFTGLESFYSRLY